MQSAKGNLNVLKSSIGLKISVYITCFFVQKCLSFLSYGPYLLFLDKSFFFTKKSSSFFNLNND